MTDAAHHVYNPLDTRNLGESVERALLESPCEPLPPSESFSGAGIYAIYYQGDFAPYAPISNEDCQQPIYVGKAIPPGARRGGFGLGAPPGRALYGRLRHHSQSIELAINLNLADFRCRYLIVEDIWIPLGESLLIAHFRPLWNSGPVQGFGINDPGKGRYNQERSQWDELHPGRPWHAKMQPAARAAEGLIEDIAPYFAGELPPRAPESDEEDEVPVAVPEPEPESES